MQRMSELAYQVNFSRTLSPGLTERELCIISLQFAILFQFIFIPSGKLINHGSFLARGKKKKKKITKQWIQGYFFNLFI